MSKSRKKESTLTGKKKKASAKKKAKPVSKKARPVKSIVKPVADKYYSDILSSGSKGTLLESTGNKKADLSNGGIKERVTYTKKELDRIIKNYLGDKPELYELASLIAKNGDSALRSVRDGNSRELKKKSVNAVLEAIVRTDGSRPSFLVKKGEVDLKSSPVGDWEIDIIASQDGLANLFARVGRIDDEVLPQQFAGTGFLVHDNYILTNRHVLQLIGARDNKGQWKIKKDIAIDFGHEFRNNDPSIKKMLKRVVFASNKSISTQGAIDHSKLDLALIELEAATPEQKPRGTFCLDISKDWPGPDVSIYTIGYPGSPASGIDSISLLEKLFQATWGKKRIAPGKVMQNANGLPGWTLSHDATTLGGNSGSLIVTIGREGLAAGLHYGGSSGSTRVNWGHVLGGTLDTVNGTGGDTLKKSLQDIGVCFVDRNTIS